VADSRYVAKIPKGFDYLDISPHFCAGVTTYKAVKVSGSDSSRTVLISGVGGLGHMALQYAKVTGARIIAVDTSEGKLELARKLGADETINAMSKEVAKTVRGLGGATAGSPPIKSFLRPNRVSNRVLTIHTKKRYVVPCRTTQQND
jgi:alcohol dehydrogenase, propanol-preferring